jgi:putative phosphoesterase
MRVAALCDVHGNLPALEAVLAEVASLDVDRIVCGGDVIMGPFSSECVGRLQLLDAVFVRGNAERTPEGVPTEYRPAADWVADQLGDETLAWLRALPPAVSLGGVRYCHGSPRDDNEILTRVSPDDRFRAALEGVEERLVVGGHTHVQFVREIDGIRFVNAGSVGMPYEGKQGAFWALLDGEEVDLRHTPYAVEAAVAAIRASGYPGAEQLTGWLLEPEDPDVVSAYFESVAT